MQESKPALKFIFTKESPVTKLKFLKFIKITSRRHVLLCIYQGKFCFGKLRKNATKSLALLSVGFQARVRALQGIMLYQGTSR